MKWMYDMYIKDPLKRKEIYASPLRASLDQLRGLPPVLIQVAENDVLRDEGEAFGRKLSDAGVRTATVRYNGVIHDFGLLNGLADIPQTHALFLHAASELKKFCNNKLFTLIRHIYRSLVNHLICRASRYWQHRGITFSGN